MRVCVLPADLDASGCYRAMFPMMHLGELGHETAMPEFFLTDNQGRMVRPNPGAGLQAVPAGDFIVHYTGDIPDADVYVFQSGKHRWQLDLLRKVKSAGVVVDMDDDLRLVPAYNPGRLEESQNRDVNGRIAEDCVREADAVTVTTQSLADVYRRFNENVHVLPNCLHWPMWEPIAPVCDEKGWGKVRVGYMGGYDFHAADVKTIAKELRLWLRRNPDVEFVAAGDPRFHDLIGVPEAQRVSTSKVWFRNMDLPYITATFDIGLIPLVQNRFNEGKSYLKGLEYSASGIVPLASPTEPYRGFIRDGDTGFLCGSPREFVERLDVLVADDDLRERMGRAARASARQHSLDLHIHEWERVYESVCPAEQKQAA